MKKDQILVVAGPTAVGKSAAALRLAEELDGEIVSCDSMQLYRYMDIGSAKPTAEERQRVRHWLVDEIDPRTPITAARYREMARAAIFDILSRGRLPVIVGGTGLYLNALLYEMDFGPAGADPALRQRLEEIAAEEGGEALHARLTRLDPEAAQRIHPHNIKKLIRALEAAESGGRIGAFSTVREKVKDYEPLLIGLKRDRQELYQRIDARVLRLVEQGLFAEVAALMAKGLDENDQAMKGIGYKEIIAYYHGRIDRETAIAEVQKNTRHYAKRQMTWFRRYEDMRWFDLSAAVSEEAAVEEILDWVRRNR
ncbi:MAG: tRNA (adenosine(37)-N6)-dimethylallyltransferase MiaA [Anaerovoracaceae bacterium]|jgi:tRNA dimethylallyltransferase